MIPKKKLAENDTHVYYTDGTVLLKRNAPAASPVPENKIEGDKGEGFTQGEWKIDYKQGADFPIWNERECICTVWASMEAEANARLIAAAPDMYKALSSIISDLPFQPSAETYEKIKSVIDKINLK